MIKKLILQPGLLLCYCNDFYAFDLNLSKMSFKISICQERKNEDTVYCRQLENELKR